jgi:hypothetical protein
MRASASNTASTTVGAKAQRGLVEEDQVRLGRERPRDRELLLLAAGEDSAERLR